MEFTLVFILLLLFGPPLALGLLGVRFWKLSRLDALTGRARTRRMQWLAVLAGGLTLSLYVLVVVVSARLPSAHAASSSAWPWGEEHPVSAVLLASLVVTLLLVRQPDQRLAGLSFAAGAGVVLCGLGLFWYGAFYPEEHLQQMRLADATYRRTGRQAVALDSFNRQVPRCHSVQELDVTDPVFPGGQEALEQQLKALLRPAAPHPPLDSYVTVEFIVEATGRITFPHVSDGLGPGYDEEAVRVVRRLPPFTPALDRQRQPVAVVWQVYVPFAR